MTTRRRLSLFIKLINASVCKVKKLHLQSKQNGKKLKNLNDGFHWPYVASRCRKKLERSCPWALWWSITKSYVHATMSINKCEDIRKMLHFDDKRTRAKGLKEDQLAAFWHIWKLLPTLSEYFLGITGIGYEVEIRSDKDFTPIIFAITIEFVSSLSRCERRIILRFCRRPYCSRLFSFSSSLAYWFFISEKYTFRFGNFNFLFFIEFG